MKNKIKIYMFLMIHELFQHYFRLNTVFIIIYMQSRTRNNQKLVEQFYKEAGLDSQLQLPLQLPNKKSKKAIVDEKKKKKCIEQDKNITLNQKTAKNSQNTFINAQENKKQLTNQENVQQKQSRKIKKLSKQIKNQDISSNISLNRSQNKSQNEIQLPLIPQIIIQKQPQLPQQKIQRQLQQLPKQLSKQFQLIHKQLQKPQILHKQSQLLHISQQPQLILKQSQQISKQSQLISKQQQLFDKQQQRQFLQKQQQLQNDQQQKLQLKAKQKRQRAQQQRQRVQYEPLPQQSPLSNQPDINICYRGVRRESEHPLLQLQKYLRRPNYIRIEQNKRICGYVGHGTTILKRPIVQGRYYVEVKIGWVGEGGTEYSPAVRVGVCAYGYDSHVPLGLSHSVAYRSSDGRLVVDGETRQFAEGYGQGDVVGLALCVQPPHKYPRPDLCNAGSTLCFLKNGRVVGQYTGLRQLFYSFAVSTFNHAHLELRIQAQDMEYHLHNYSPYAQVFQERIPYKSLENSIMFTSLAE